jgi:hypothetical protein
VDTINYITGKQRHKSKGHMASFGNSTVEKLLFLLCTTKKSARTISKIKTILVNNKVILRKPIKVINNDNNSINYLLLFTF